MSITEAAKLRRQADEALKKARAIHDAAEKESRNLTAEEQQQYDGFDQEFEGLISRAERLEKLVDQEKRMVEEELERRDREGDPGRQPTGAAVVDSEEYRAAWWRHLRFGPEEMKPDELELLQRARSQVDPNLRQAARAMGTGTVAGGGFALPGATVRGIVEAQKEFGSVEAAGAFAFETGDGNDIQFPTVDETSVYGRRLGESKSATALDPTSGKIVTLKAHIYTSDKITVPIPLLNDAAVDLEAWIRMKLAERIGRKQNQDFTIGDGAAGPQGVVTGATLGKQGAAGNSTTITDGDDLIDLQESIDPAYRSGAAWMFHQNSFRDIRKLKDGQGRWIFEPALANRAPASILGDRYVLNAEMATMAASAKPILYGNFRFYYIRRVTDRMIFRLDQVAATEFSVVFVGFERADGAMIDAGTHPIKYWQNSAT